MKIWGFKTAIEVGS